MSQPGARAKAQTQISVYAGLALKNQVKVGEFLGTAGSEEFGVSNSFLGQGKLKPFVRTSGGVGISLWSDDRAQRVSRFLGCKGTACAKRPQPSLFTHFPS